MLGNHANERARKFENRSQNGGSFDNTFNIRYKFYKGGKIYSS